jgi:D-alanine--poly(phosphoribitol) ligase subunit 1
VSEHAGREPLIHLAVARHAALRPTATALVHRGRPIDYRTLDAAAGAYAAGLAGRGVAPGQVIPLLAPRSAALVIAQLAVLKCGAAYACLDQRWPERRRAAILGQISPMIVIAHNDHHVGRFPVHPMPAEDLTTIRYGSGGGHHVENARPDGSAPAMIFFTSGTTGGPKGVITPHRAVTRLFQPGGLPGFGPGHATPQAAPLAWDMHAFELWGQLTSGGTSVLVEEDHLLPGRLSVLVRSHGVDTLWLTSSLFNLFVEEDPDCFTGLGHVFTGGEKLSADHVRRFVLHHPRIPLRNGYGPAESCMLTTTRLIGPDDCDRPGGIPLGTAVPGTRVYVLDAEGRPCPAGGPGESGPGEICVAGLGLAIGYLGDPELTAARFRMVAVGGSPVRVYLTGDIGTLDGAGILHFLGRGDRQVKISGHRVEPAEVEAAARALAGVRDCVTIPLTAPDGSVSRLALFYLDDRCGSQDPQDQPLPDRKMPDQALSDQALSDPLDVRGSLLRVLPRYLMPAPVRRVPRFPVTANGKLDVAALLRLAGRPEQGEFGPLESGG